MRPHLAIVVSKCAFQLQPASDKHDADDDGNILALQCPTVVRTRHIRVLDFGPLSIFLAVFVSPSIAKNVFFGGGG